MEHDEAATLERVEQMRRMSTIDSLGDDSTSTGVGVGHSQLANTGIDIGVDPIFLAFLAGGMFIAGIVSLVSSKSRRFRVSRTYSP